jgi:hypothetical protein
MKQRIFVLLVVVGLGLVGKQAWAQTLTGSIQGVITDPHAKRVTSAYTYLHKEFPPM